MSLTIEAAYDEIQALVLAGWEAAAVLLDIDSMPLLFPDKPDDTPLDGVWGKSIVEHYHGEKATLGGGSGQQIYTNKGLLMVQVYTPSGSGLRLSHRLGNILVGSHRCSDGRALFALDDQHGWRNA